MTMPVAPLARNGPTAGEDCTTWSVLYSHRNPPAGRPVPALPEGAKTRR